MRRFFITSLDFISKYHLKTLLQQSALKKRFLNRMSIESSIERQIQKAIAEGAFENLEGEGKPLNLDAYFAAPEDVRMGYSILKSNQFVPEEVDRFKEISDLKAKLKNCTDAQEKQKLTKTLNEKNLALAIILERNKRKR